MKTEDLQAIGLDEDQIKKVFELNGKDIAAAQKATQKAEADRDAWQKRAETAEETLKGFDGVDIEKMKADVESWKKKAEDEAAQYQKDLEERDFSDALRTALEDVKFSSESAKKAVIAEIKAAGLSMRSGKIVGLQDVLDQIKADDASAFASAEGGAKFTTPPKGTGKTVKGFADMTLGEKMRYANEHPDSDDVRNWLARQ